MIPAHASLAVAPFPSFPGVPGGGTDDPGDGAPEFLQELRSEGTLQSRVSLRASSRETWKEDNKPGVL